jgi:acetoin utilization deacetylase AcuC-like enzyme
VKRVGLLYDDIYLKHRMPEGHPESPERLVAIMDKLRGSGIWDDLVKLTPRKATREEILSVHKEKHIEHLSKLVGYSDPDTYVSEGSYEAALFAAGAPLEAIDRIKSGEIDRAFCAVRPPGHHAEAGRTSGFCLFNNIAVGARYAQDKGYGNVFIVDFDVHHGNGTEHMFEGDNSVFYFSTHQHPHFPGTGADHEKGHGEGYGYTVNYPMGQGLGDEEYLAIYQDVLPGLIAGFSPDIIMVSAGYDLHARDPLANIRVSDHGLESIIDAILSSCRAPFVFCLEGGYNLDVLSEGVLMTIRALMSKQTDSC